MIITDIKQNGIVFLKKTLLNPSPFWQFTLLTLTLFLFSLMIPLFFLIQSPPSPRSLKPHPLPFVSTPTPAMPQASDIAWQKPTQKEDLSLFDPGMEKQVTYYKVGTITKGALKGSELIYGFSSLNPTLWSADWKIRDPKGAAYIPSDIGVIYRFAYNNSHAKLLCNTYTKEEKAYYSDSYISVCLDPSLLPQFFNTKQVSLDPTTPLAPFPLPTRIHPPLDTTTTLARQDARAFLLTPKQKPLFFLPQGYVSYYPSSSQFIPKNSTTVLTYQDGFSYPYILIPNVPLDHERLHILDNTYTFLLHDNCNTGNLAADIVSLPKEALRQTMLPTIPTRLYTLLRPNQDLYHQMLFKTWHSLGSNLSFEDFLTTKPVFYYTDFFGRIIRITNDRYLPVTSCG